MRGGERRGLASSLIVVGNWVGPNEGSGVNAAGRTMIGGTVQGQDRRLSRGLSDAVLVRVGIDGRRLEFSLNYVIPISSDLAM